jgi:peptide/nickel transport system ATP-binding protein
MPIVESIDKSIDAGATAAPLLEVRALRVAFGASEAVRGVSFAIAPGETLGLVGESGSGKSLTSLAAMRLLPPDARVAGSIRLAGEELLSLPEPAMRRHRGRSLAMVFQEPMTALNPVMSVGEQMGEALLAHVRRDWLGRPVELSRAQLRQRVIEAMHAVGLPEPERRLRDYPHLFSGGQRQRIAIAMALMNRPRLLIADEPTTALDVTVQAQVLGLLRTLRVEYALAMLFISHDLAVVGQVADRIAVMRHGEIVEMGPAQAVLTAPQHPYTRQLLASAPTMRTDRTQPLATLR